MKKYPLLICLGGLTLLFSVFLLDLWLLGYTYVSSDSSNAGLAGSIAQQLYGERTPVWTPAVFCGLPAYESLYYAPDTYFPNHFLSLFGQFYLVIYFVFGALGVLLICREFELSWLAGFFGAASFGLSPWLIGNYAFGHGSQVISAMYLPWIFLFTCRLLNRERIPASAALLALTLGFMLQRGHTQIAYYGLLLSGSTALFYVFIAKDRIFRLAGLVLSIVFGFLLSANLYYPLYKYLPYSTRVSMTANYATSWSLHPREMITFILPDYYGFGGMNYHGHFSFTEFPLFFGFVPVAFALLAVWHYRKRKHVWLLGGIMTLSLFVAFGKYAPVYALFHEFMPYFKNFRVPSMAIILVYLAVSILSAFGFYAIERRKYGRYVAIPLASVALFHLWTVDKRIGHLVKDPGAATAVRFSFLGLARVHGVGALFSSGAANQLGFESTGGYHAAKLANYQRFLNLTAGEANISPAFLTLTASTLVLSPSRLNFAWLEPADSVDLGNQKGFFYRSQAKNPRAFLVGSYIVTDQPVAFNPATTALLKEQLPLALAFDSTARAEIIDYKPDGVILRTTASKPQLLILCDTYYPNWKATVNGSEAKIYEANMAFRGVLVPAGASTVIFSYGDRAISLAKLVSWITLVTIIAALGASWYKYEAFL